MAGVLGQFSLTGERGLEPADLVVGGVAGPGVLVGGVRPGRRRGGWVAADGGGARGDVLDGAQGGGGGEVDRPGAEQERERTADEQGASEALVGLLADAQRAADD